MVMMAKAVTGVAVHNERVATLRGLAVLASLGCCASTVRVEKGGEVSWPPVTPDGRMASAGCSGCYQIHQDRAQVLKCG